MEYFVHPTSVVRKIWGKSDIILFIFAGSAAEFALNKSVDWLFFTGRLPADPLGRLFSTVAYARRIVFSELNAAYQTIDRMASIHESVETARQSEIQDWAYRDVLYMLIDYSIRSHELLEGKLSQRDKEEVYRVFKRVGDRMGVKDLPETFDAWLTDRILHLKADLDKSIYTEKLFLQYRKHLGGLRYQLLLQGQAVIVPESVRILLGLNKSLLFRMMLASYKLSMKMQADWFFKKIILPRAYFGQVRALDAE